MTTTTTDVYYEAKLARVELDDDYVGSEPHGEPMTPELWMTVDHRGGEQYGKDSDLPALVGHILADARLRGDLPVRWTLTGVPPAGRGTVAEAVADLGVTLHERWPDGWR